MLCYQDSDHHYQVLLLLLLTVSAALLSLIQNKPVMALGLFTITLCVGYLGYLHAVKENSQELYEAVDSEGERYMRRKTSKWD